MKKLLIFLIMAGFSSLVSAQSISVRLDLLLSTGYVSGLGVTRVELRTLPSHQIEITESLPPHGCEHVQPHQPCDPIPSGKVRTVVIPTVISDKRPVDGALTIQLGDKYILAVADGRNSNRPEGGSVYYLISGEKSFPLSVLVDLSIGN